MWTVIAMALADVFASIYSIVRKNEYPLPARVNIIAARGMHLNDVLAGLQRHYFLSISYHAIHDAAM